MNLEYLVDNGRLRGWPIATESGCTLVKYVQDGDYSVLDANGKPLGWGETPDDAVSAARLVLTDRRRKADGIVPAKVC